MKGNFSLGAGGLLGLIMMLAVLTLILAGLLAWQGFWPVLAIAIIQVILVSWILVRAWERAWQVEIIEGDTPEEQAKNLVAKLVVRAFEFSQEVRFFTYELSERYEEINLLYSISETLGSLLQLDEAARAILGEVCDVIGAKRGSLWVFEAESELLQLVADRVGRVQAGHRLLKDYGDAPAADRADRLAADRQCVRGGRYGNVCQQPAARDVQ